MHLFRFLILGLPVVFCLGCQKKSEEKGLSTRGRPARLKSAAVTCNPHPSDDSPKVSRPVSELDLDIPFDKPLEADSLFNLRLKSAEKLWNHLRNVEKVKVFAFENQLKIGRPYFFSKSENCDYYYDLAYVSPAEQDRWKKFSEGNEPSILGLFLYNEIEGSVKVNDPKIYVHAQTSKWTLFHESLHYYFRKAEFLSKDYISGFQLDYQANQLINKLKELENSHNLSETQRSDLIQLLVENAKLLSYRMKQTDLEELAIEYITTQLYYKGEFAPSLNQYEAGREYGKNSAEVSETRISTYVDMLLFVSQDLQSQMSSAERSKISDSIKNLQTLGRQIQLTLNRLDAYKFMNVVTNVSQKSSFLEIPFQNSQKLEPIDQKLDDLNQRLNNFVSQHIL